MWNKGVTAVTFMNDAQNYGKNTQLKQDCTLHKNSSCYFSS